MDWENVVLRKRIEYTNLVLQSALDILPSGITGINFVLLLDDLRPSHILKNPRLGTSFLRAFVHRCPDGYLKRAVMVTGSTGRAFYNIAKAVGPQSIVQRITVVKDRNQAASLLLDNGMIQGENNVPKFLGGHNLEHSDDVTKTLRGMMSHLYRQFGTSCVGDNISNCESNP